MRSWGHQQRRFRRAMYSYRHMLFQLMVIAIIFVGYGVSVTHAQTQNPPDVTDPDNYASETGPIVPATPPDAIPPGNQVVDPTTATGIPNVTTDVTNENAANQALGLLTAGVGLAAGAGLARGGPSPVAPSGPFTWPAWARPVSQQIEGQPPVFWQRLLRTGQAWVNTDFHLVVREESIILQRVEGARVLADHPIATIQPGGINFHWGPVAQNATDEDRLRIMVVGRPDEALLEDLDAIHNPYERFLMVQEQRPDLITNQAYPTAEIGDHAHIVMENPLTEIGAGSEVDYAMNLGNVLYDITNPPSVRGFVINDPQLAGQEGVPTYVPDPDGNQWEDAHWTIPGTHTLVYEVQYEGQLPRYYTLQQTVVERHELAAQRLQEVPTPLNPDLYLLSLQTTLQQVEQQGGGDEDRLEQFRASVENATELLAEGGTPIQAVLVADETSQAIPLTLFLQQTEDGYAVVDLTNPHPDAARTYEGDTAEEAWEDFLRNNTLPAGQIAATPPDGVDATTDLWNTHSDGQSTLQQWSNGLGIFSFVALGAGVVLMFVPGGQIPGGLIIGALGASAGAGALSAGLSMADRAQHGNLTWNTQTQLELLDLAGSLLVGGALARAGTQLSVRQVGRMGVALEIVGTGTDVTSAILLTNEYYQQIEAIRNSDLSELRKQEAIREVLTSAAQLGGLIVLGAGLSQVDFSRIRGAVNLPDVPSGLRDTINSSPVLQQILANQNYDPATLQGLWRTWGRMPGHVPTDFAAWVQSLQRSGVSLDVANRFFNDPAVFQRLREQPDLMAQFAAHPEYMELALSDPTMMRRLLDNPSVSPAIGMFETVTPEMMQAALPDDFVAALRTFGKSDDDIYAYFANYHNGRSGQGFLNDITTFMESANVHGLTDAEAFAVWGYTTNYFYRDLNGWLRTGTNVAQTAEMRALINSGLAKLPDYSGTHVYRGISIDDSQLQNFLNSYSAGSTTTWNDFTSAGGSLDASFAGRPDVNVVFSIEHLNAKDISDLADGVRYGGMPPPELLLPSGSEVRVMEPPRFDPATNRWFITVTQVQ
ncbi:MAG: hypothetical protein AAGF95_13875 [Chloroflexota bacterium]